MLRTRLHPAGGTVASNARQSLHHAPAEKVHNAEHVHQTLSCAVPLHSSVHCTTFERAANTKGWKLHTAINGQARELQLQKLLSQQPILDFLNNFLGDRLVRSGDAIQKGHLQRGKRYL